MRDKHWWSHSTRLRDVAEIWTEVSHPSSHILCLGLITLAHKADTYTGISVTTLARKSRFFLAIKGQTPISSFSLPTPSNEGVYLFQRKSAASSISWKDFGWHFSGSRWHTIRILRYDTLHVVIDTCPMLYFTYKISYDIYLVFRSIWYTILKIFCIYLHILVF